MTSDIAKLVIPRLIQMRDALNQDIREIQKLCVHKTLEGESTLEPSMSDGYVRCTACEALLDVDQST